MKNRVQDHVKKASVTCSRLYAALMLSVFIFGFHDNYIDIQDFKSKLFLSMSSVYLVLEFLFLLPLLFLHLRGQDRDMPVPGKAPVEKSRLIFPLLFAVSILLGWLFSEWPSQAASGSSGRQLGAIPLLLCILVYFSLSLTFEHHRLLTLVFTVSAAAQILLGILNLWGLDPLGMYVNLIDEQHAFFIGTVGNKNVTSCYLCLVVPILAALFSFSKGWRRTLYAGLVFLGFYYGFGVSSDSFLIGMAAAFLVLLWYALSGNTAGGNGLFCPAALFGLYCAAALAMFATVRLVRSPFILAFPGSGLIGNALKPAGLVITGLTGALLFLFAIRVAGKQKVCFLLSGRRVLFIALAGISAAVVICCIIINLLPAEGQAALPAPLSRLILTDSFGSNRGYIWKRSAEVFAGLPFVKKLIGVGADCFYLLMMPLYGNEMTILYGAPFADAHNEFLQFLVTTGILGVTGYFGTILAGFFRKGESRGTAPVRQIFRMAAAAYITQGMVNNPQIMTTPLLFIFLGVCNSLS